MEQHMVFITVGKDMIGFHGSLRKHCVPEIVCAPRERHA